MRMTSFTFRDTLKVNADYGTIVASFKSRLNENFFKGYIDKDDTQLFYISGLLRRPFGVNLPLIQINFENKKTDDRQIIIKFKIVNFALILFAFANVSIFVSAIAGLVSHGPNQVPTEVPAVVFIVSYAFLLFKYLIELSEFKKEIKRFQ